MENIFSVSDFQYLPNTAFHLEIDEAFQFNRIFHRELTDEVVDEPVNGQRHRLALVESTLLHVEQHFLGHLRDRSFVLSCVAVTFHRDRRVGVGARITIDQQRIALRVIFASFEMFRDVDLATIRRSTLAN